MNDFRVIWSLLKMNVVGPLITEFVSSVVTIQIRWISYVNKR